MPQPNTTNTVFNNGLEASKFLNIPRSDSPSTTGLLQGALNYFPTEDKLKYWDGTTWQPIAAGVIETPNLQEVTNGAGNNLTTNIIGVTGESNLPSDFTGTALGHRLTGEINSGVTKFNEGIGVGGLNLEDLRSELFFESSSFSLRTEDGTTAGAYINRRLEISNGVNSQDAVTMNQLAASAGTLQSVTTGVDNNVTTNSVHIAGENNYNSEADGLSLSALIDGTTSTSFLENRKGALERDRTIISIVNSTTGISGNGQIHFYIGGSDNAKRTLTLYDNTSGSLDGEVAVFTGKVKGFDATENDQFTTLGQVNALIPAAGTLQSVTTGAGNNETTNALLIKGATGLDLDTDGLGIFRSGTGAALYNITSGAVSSYITLDDTGGDMTFRPNGTTNNYGLTLAKVVNTTSKVANFDGRVSGANAVSSDEFITLGQITASLGDFVPYTGATGNVNLGSNNITSNSFIKSGGTSSQFLKADGSVDGNTYQNTSQKNQANGYAGLDSGVKIFLSQLPDSILGALIYQGTWNATTNSPTLSNPPSSDTKGHYYVTNTAGTQFGITFAVGDWIVSNGTEWQKVDNSDAVTTVFGRLGNVVANEGDYSSFYPLLNGTGATGTWGINISGNAATANTATLWNGLTFNGTFQPVGSGIMSYQGGTTMAISNLSETQSWLDINNGATLNNSISGNAATATALVVPDDLQSVTDRGSITTNPITINSGTATGVNFQRSSAAIGQIDFSGNDLNISATNDLLLQPTAGNVGIGTTTASAKLDVNGDASFRPGTNRNIKFRQLGMNLAISAVNDSDVSIPLGIYTSGLTVNTPLTDFTGSVTVTNAPVNPTDVLRLTDLSGYATTASLANYVNTTGNQTGILGDKGWSGDQTIASGKNIIFVGGSSGLRGASGITLSGNADGSNAWAIVAGNGVLSSPGGKMFFTRFNQIVWQSATTSNAKSLTASDRTFNANYTFDLPDASGMLNVFNTSTAPSTSSSTGSTGEIRVSGGYMYICIATDSWVRSAVATF